MQKNGFWQADSVLVLVERMKDKTPLLEAVVTHYFDKKPTPQYVSDSKGTELLATSNPIINDIIMAKSEAHIYPIVYFDDLSYNHENGEVLYYEEVIKAVQKMPIRYIGYAELIKMQTNNS